MLDKIAISAYILNILQMDPFLKLQMRTKEDFKLLKFLLNFTLLKYVKSQRSYGFLITKELIFWLPNFWNIFTF